MKKLLYLLFPLLLIGSAFADYVQTYKIVEDTTTETSDIILKGNMYISDSTETANAFVVLASTDTYPLKLTGGSLQIFTTSYGILFAISDSSIPRVSACIR